MDLPHVLLISNFLLRRFIPTGRPSLVFPLALLLLLDLVRFYRSLLGPLRTRLGQRFWP